MKKAWIVLLFCSWLFARDLPISEINSALTAALKTMPGMENKEISVNAQLKASPKKEWISVSENYRIEFILPPANQIQSFMHFKMQLYQPGAKTITYRIKFQVQLIEPVYHAQKNLERNEPLSAAALTLRKVNLLELSGKPLTAGYNFENKIMRSNVKAGMPLLTWMASVKPLASPGDLITVTVIYGQIQMKLPAKVLQQGHLGEKVRVQLIKTKKIFKALIKSSTEFLIYL